MDKKTIKTIAMVVFATLAGYGGVKAYGYSYGKSVNSKDNLLMQNIEALSDGEYQTYIPCKPNEEKSCSFEGVDAVGNVFPFDISGMEKVETQQTN